jgi:hypothetical protein
VNYNVINTAQQANRSTSTGMSEWPWPRRLGLDFELQLTYSIITECSYQPTRLTARTITVPTLVCWATEFALTNFSPDDFYYNSCAMETVWHSLFVCT